MSCNKYKKHLVVLPEDDANRQLANGFERGISYNRNLQVERVATGWKSVCDKFQIEHIQGLRSYSERHLILLIDFDNQVDERKTLINGLIPSDVSDRVFMLGTLSEPEMLTQAGLGTLEKIGQSLADECRNGTLEGCWSHELLKHNQDEVDRLRRTVRSFLF